MNEKKSNKWIRASIIVSIISILGKVIGFSRDAVIAAFYGADWRTDAFFFAQSMPSIIFPAICNSLSTTFLTIYVSKRVTEEREAEQYASKILTFCFVVAAGLSIIAMIAAPVLVPILAPGFNGEKELLAIHLTRITMVAFSLIMLQYVFSAILSAKKFFVGAQIASLVFNSFVICTTVLLGKNQSTDVLTWTVVIGHAVEIITLLILLSKKFVYNFIWRVWDNDTKNLLKLAFPVIIGNGIVQINNIVDKVLSSLLGNGAVSALSYSGTLNRFVTGIFVTTISTVIYPTMTEAYSSGDKKYYHDMVAKGTVMSMLLLLPVSIVTSFCATDIVKIVYERGSFSGEATSLTAAALAFYGCMYLFSAIQEIMVRAFYAQKDTKTPLKSASIAIMANAVISIILSKVLGIGGIALGTTLSTFLAAFLLLITFKKKNKEFRIRTIFSSIWRMCVSCFIMTLVVFLLRSVLADIPEIIRFFSIALFAFGVHFSVLYALKCKEVRDITAYIQGKLRKP